MVFDGETGFFDFYAYMITFISAGQIKDANEYNKQKTKDDKK
jgi:hypothetical protein